MRGLRIAVAGVLAALLLTGCIRYDGAHKGRVVDADTGEPIEGVVVLGVWSREYAGPAGGTHKYYDARETVTDKDGEFYIPGVGLTGGVLSFVEPMQVLIFKAGYQYIDAWWDKLQVKYTYMPRADARIEGDKVIISLKKLTMEEREKRGTPPLPRSEVPEDKIKLWMEEINKDRRERGLESLD